MTKNKGKVPLTTQMAQRMYQAQRDLPRDSKEDTRHAFESMANEARRTMGEQLEEFSAAITRLCVSKKHKNSVPPTTDGGSGAPCPQCRLQVRSMSSAIKLVMPTSED